ncbi:PIG-L family deacetylase [Caulobacter sp. 602-2]|uniref:PIG-L family deacetylase n=1 Tax=Caulobacter sp. 602-2 TaxID=2710887 RepID=A0A6G4QUY3_9CAUL|nr:PIG-L family deacetylase [Caulobacter sp. 602-2]NGM49342.1 PIG-L family deacetylase [Caulobacter sp. 602-2]
MVTPAGETVWGALVNQAFTIDDSVLEGLSTMLVIAQHPGDETLGCGGLLARGAERGLRPRVAFLADGEGSCPRAPERLARQRRSEAIRALETLGVPKSDVLFLDWPGHRPRPSGLAAYQETLKALEDWCSAFTPWSIWTPWRGETNVARIAAAELGADLRGRLARNVAVMEYLVWGWTDPDLVQRHGAKNVWGLACADLIERRRRSLQAHATQLGPMTDDQPRPALPPEIAALVGRPFEIFLERRL